MRPEAPVADHHTADLGMRFTRRRSIRTFSGGPIRARALSTIFWAANGVLNDGRRTTPSAGGLYPLDLRLAAFSTDGLPAGLYAYGDGGAPFTRMDDHPLTPGLIAEAALGEQTWIERAAAVALVSGFVDPVRTAFAHQPPPNRWRRYPLIECGAAAQNAAFAASDLGVGMTVVAGFDDAAVSSLFRLPYDALEPLTLLVMGDPAPETATAA